jgi:hypothetical protein
VCTSSQHICHYLIKLFLLRQILSPIKYLPNLSEEEEGLEENESTTNVKYDTGVIKIDETLSKRTQILPVLEPPQLFLRLMMMRYSIQLSRVMAMNLIAPLLFVHLRRGLAS